MSVTVRWARVQDDEGVFAAVLSFGYRADLVEAIKAAAPLRSRRWVPEAKMWVVALPWVNLVLDKMKSCGDVTTVHDQGIGPVYKARRAAAADAANKAKPADHRVCTCSHSTVMGPHDHKVGCPFYAPFCQGPSAPGVGSTYIPRSSPWRETVFEGSWRDFEQFMRSQEMPRAGAARPSPPPQARRGMWPTDDDYRVLGVAQSADLQAVKVAHRRLALENHPDRGGDTQKLARINVARDRVVYALGQR